MENFNELFKKKLAEQQFEGKEKYWNQLEQKLNASAQEKVVAAWYKKWLLPVIAIFAIGAAALFFTNSDMGKTQNELASNSSSKELQTNTAQENGSAISNTNIELDQNENASQNSATKDLETIAEANTKSTIETKNSSSLKNANVNTENKVAAIASVSPVKSNAKVITSVNFEKTAMAVNSKVNANKSSNNNKSKEPVLSNSAIEETAIIAASNLSTNMQNESLQQVQPANANEIIQNQNDAYVAQNTSKALNFSQVEMPLALLNPKSLGALIYPAAASSLAANMLPINQSKAKMKLSLSVYGGAMMSMKNLLTSDGNTADYLDKRKKEETNSIKPNIGIDIELKRGHWSLTSGFNFHQQGEKRDYNDQFKRMVPYDSLVIAINDNSAWLVDSSMFYALQYNSIITSHDTTITYYDETSGQFYTALLPINITQTTLVDTNHYYLIDSTYNQDIDTIKTNYALKKQLLVKDPNQANLKGRNTFSYIEIPVLLGYEWGIRRWRLSVKGGIGFGILTRQQSFYLSTDEAEIAPISTDVYTKIIYNGIVRAGLHYNFTPQFGIDIVPFSRININNMTNKNATFQQKYSNVGLQLGLNYKL